MASDRALLTVRPDDRGATIRPGLHGQFVEHVGRGVYDGIWVGPASAIPNTRGMRNDVLAALRRLAVPVVRWPGGCFADDYHWRDGIGPRVQRPARENHNWGGVETNAFGTHEFMDFVELVGAVPYMNGGIGGGDPDELADWVEYVTADSKSSLGALRRKNGRRDPWALPYLGFGNEPWGCGGGMSAEQYAGEYRRFSERVSCRTATATCRIAAGGDGENLRWTDVLMSEAGPQMDALTVHYYTLPTGDWERKGPATGFGPADWASTLSQCLRLDRLLGAHEAIMDRYDPGGRIALVVDEWGTWYDPEPGTAPSALEQQNSLRDALVAALTLNVLHAHAGRVRMANLAQLANVLQALVRTEGGSMVLTPTYHVFEMYRAFRGATSLPVELEAAEIRIGDATVPPVHASAARDGGGRLLLGLVNLLPDGPVLVCLRIAGGAPGRATARVLTGPAIDSVNRREDPDAVAPAPFDRVGLRHGLLELELPARSVTVVQLT